MNSSGIVSRGDLARASDDELLAAWTDLEAERRRLVSREHGLIAEIDARRLAQERGMRSTAVLGNRLLRISAAEANVRVAAAADMGPRRGLTGDVLPPIYPLVADAQAEGAISAQHAKLVVDAVEKLPDSVRAEIEDQVEADLVAACRQFDPKTVTVLAKRILATVDPDGALKDVEYWHQRRSLQILRRSDGSARIEGDLDVECAEYLLTALTPLAAPKPAADGTRDPRSSGQRWHDALLDLAQRSLRTGAVPSTAGILTTVLLHGTPEQFRTGEGMVRTGTGSYVPTTEAKRWASSDSRFFAVLIDKAKQRPVAYTTGTRLFTENQRLAMISRDKGCSFPGCTSPPALCQAHHVTDWAHGGPTSIDNGALVCGFHHREFASLGWSCRLIDGIPHWTAPQWLDPAHEPQRNRAHNPALCTD